MFIKIDAYLLMVLIMEGDLKKRLVQETGLEPKDQRLLFRGKWDRWSGVFATGRGEWWIKVIALGGNDKQREKTWRGEKKWWDIKGM